ncbi:MAG TPA: hypothetical protein VHD90_00235 [Phototrophicaceae bacterium]|nr:hypothetical protein [Phototrophicaceae bacterium]
MSSQNDLHEQTQLASQIQAKYANDLMQKPNVIGVGVGHPISNGVRSPNVGLIVMVDHKIPLDELAPDDVIPKQLEGVQVDVQEMGAFRAQ